MSLYGKSFLKLLDLSSQEIEDLLALAADLKKKKKAGIPHKLCEGKNIALIFEKTSTRTRCAFEVAAHDLGMGVTYLDPSGSQISKKESAADTARVLGRMFDGIEYRGFGQTIVEQLADYAGVPVWNGLTNEFHPTQILADFLTITEHFGSLKGVKLVYMGMPGTVWAIRLWWAAPGWACILWPVPLRSISRIPSWWRPVRPSPRKPELFSNSMRLPRPL